MQSNPSARLPRLCALTLAAYLGAALSAAPADAAGPWTWPARGELVTAYRNGADAYAAGQHRGIDIAAAVGSPVVAATPGTVTFAGGAGTAGLTVAVRTADGRFDTSYLHLSSIDVRAGEPVADGARLGAVGVTGRRSWAAPHLHFGVRDAGSRHAYRDPLDFLGLPPPPGPPLVVPLLGPPRVAAAPLPLSAAVPRPAPSPTAIPSARAATAGGPLPRPVARPASAAGAAFAPDTGSTRVAPRPAPANASVVVARAAHRALPSPSNRPAAPGPDLGAAPAGVAESGRAPVPGGDRRPRAAAPDPGGGLDPGRGLAVLGLLAAAAIMARPAGRGVAAERGRLALGVLLRPLASRR